MKEQSHENLSQHQIYEEEQDFQLQYYEQQVDDIYQLYAPNLNSQSSQFSQPPILTYSYSGISNASSTPQFVLHSSRVSQQISPTFNFMKAQKLYSSIQKLVRQVKQALNLQQDIILCLLYKYQWSKDKLYQKHYDSANNYILLNKNLKNRLINFNQMLYGICQICEQQTKLCVNLLCNHRYCLDCWKKYIKYELNQNIIFFLCMNRCQNSFILLHHFVETFIPELFQFYRKIICINYTTYNKSISYCPSYNGQCDLFCQRADINCQIFVQCPCGQFYCFYCRNQPHYPATCNDVVKWRKLLNDQQSNSKWIEKNTKTCPSCKNPVQKYIGCSKIKCICGAQFCYECNQKWDQFHKSTKGQCTYLQRKSSLEQRTSTYDFLKLHEKCLAIDRTNKKHLQIVKLSFSEIRQQWVLVKFHGIRKQITDAWLTLKWGSITTFIYKRNQVQKFVQDQFVESIGRLIQAIQKVRNFGNMLSTKDSLVMGDQIINKAEIVRKNKEVWLEAWRNCC